VSTTFILDWSCSIPEIQLPFEALCYARVRLTRLAPLPKANRLRLTLRSLWPGRSSEFGDGSMPTVTDVEVLTMDDRAITPDLPDLLPWDRRPSTQMIPEKSAIASPYLGGSDQKPRDIRTLRRWRESRRGPSFLKIGGRYFYTIGALRDFYQRSIRGGVG
jgi:hypothetical protein